MSETRVGATHDRVASATGALDLVTRAARDGAADAREAAARTWAATSLFASRFVYTACYTVSYGVVFPTMLLARAVPRNNAVVRGMIDGAHDAVDRVDQVRSKTIRERIDAAGKALAPA
jgi:hypothetical protein